MKSNSQTTYLRKPHKLRVEKKTSPVPNLNLREDVLLHGIEDTGNNNRTSHHKPTAHTGFFVLFCFYCATSSVSVYIKLEPEI